MYCRGSRGGGGEWCPCRLMSSGYIFALAFLGNEWRGYKGGGGTSFTVRIGCGSTRPSHAAIGVGASLSSCTAATFWKPKSLRAECLDTLSQPIPPGHPPGNNSYGWIRSTSAVAGMKHLRSGYEEICGLNAVAAGRADGVP